MHEIEPRRSGPHSKILNPLLTGVRLGGYAPRKLNDNFYDVKDGRGDNRFTALVTWVVSGENNVISIVPDRRYRVSSRLQQIKDDALQGGEIRSQGS